MGLIKAIGGAAGGVLADSWKEFFYCDAIDKSTLVVKGQKRTTSRSSNTKGNDNIISSGSAIAVADGQCMIIVEQGRVVEVCAEPGEFIFDSSTEPSIFAGNLGEQIANSFKTVGRRIGFGGDTGKDQRVYYFNTKEISGNMFGTSSPIPFRIVDNKIGLDLDAEIRCNGVYSYILSDPILFYTNVCGNVEEAYTRSQIDMQLKTEFVSALAPAFAEISKLQIRPSDIPAHTEELCDLMNKALTEKWADLRGISVVSVAMNPITLPDEIAQQIRTLQMTAVNKDVNMAAATLVSAQADAMRAAANNEGNGGAVMGLMGMNMAQNAGGMNAAGLFQMGQQQQGAAQGGMQGAPGGTPAPGGAPAPAGGPGWTCECGTVNTSKFCQNCGNPQPSNTVGWTCGECGAVNKGKFCQECGKPKPEGAPLYRCDKCGWEPADPHNPPKFCPECGDIFDEKDIKQ